MDTPIVPQKRCSICKKTFPLESFANSRNGKYGKHNYCRKCAAEHKGRIWHPKCIVPDGFQQCSLCGKVLPLTIEHFRMSIREKNQLTCECKPCLVIKDRADRIKHLDKRKQSHREWAKANPDIAKSNAKKSKSARRARMMNVEGSHSARDLQALYEDQDGQCAYCGIRLFWDVLGDIHADHIVPVSRGGTNNPDNLALACADCNLGKGNSTLPEWIARRNW